MAARHKFVPVAETLRKKKEGQESRAMQFPEDLAVHAMLFSFKEYDWRGDKTATTIGDTIALPPPREFREDYRVNWSNQELGSFIGQSVDEVTNIINNWDPEKGTVADNIRAAGESLLADFTKPTDPGVYAQAAQKASGAGAAGLLAKSKALRAVGVAGGLSALGGDEISSAIAAGSGVAVNPVEAAIFKGVPLRVHNFSWRLSPKSESEDGVLRKIIHQLKTNMYPEFIGFGDGGDFGFQFPNVVDITYEGSTMENPPRFKPAVIQDMKVDYSEGGSPAFFKKTGNPVTYNLSMQLMEIDIITKADWEEEAPKEPS